MHLWIAASEAAILRSEETQGRRYDSIREFIRSHDDWMEAVMLWFDDEPRIGTTWFTSRVPDYFGVHAEEWIGLTRDNPIVPLIASESEGNHESEWSIDDAYIILSSMPSRGLSDIVDVLSEDEAYLFWQVALGEPPPISRRDMLRALAGFTPYTTTELRRVAAYTPFLEVVERAVGGVLPTTTDMKPGVPITPPARYHRWNQVKLPYLSTFVDVVDSARLFLHYTGTDALMYTRAGELVQSWDTEHPPSIYEIECSDDYDPSTIIYTDVLIHDSEMVWEKPYSERKITLSQIFNGRTQTVRQINTMGELRDTLRSLKPKQTLRLIDDVPYYDDDFIGGYIMQQQALKLPLLITHARTDERSVFIRMAAMDGHTPVYVGETVCPDDVGLNIRTHSHFGPRLTDKWTPIDDVGCVIWVSAVGMNVYDGHYHMDSPNLIALDTTMGLSDVIQMSDILSVMPD